MTEELKAELQTLKEGLEGKTQAEVKSAIEAFEAKAEKELEAKLKGLVGEEVKTIKEHHDVAVKGLKEEFEASIKTVQDHADKLDLKLQDKKSESKAKVGFVEGIKSELESNFDAIKTVRKGKSEKIEVKAVGDMTLGNNLTGDQPRSYSQTVVPVTAPILNVADILGPQINIDGGTYTFPKEIGSEGAIAWQTEGASKGQIDYDFEMVDITTDFLAGVTTYSKKMANNLPFLQSFIPGALRRDYLKQENTEFAAILATEALASTQVITGKNEAEMLMNEVATLEGLDNPVNGIVLRPEAWMDIAKTEKSAGAGYGLPGIVTYTNGQLYVNGIPVFKATWLPANKYYVGDWTRVRKVVTEGLSLEFSNENKDNFEKNNITARIEAQIGLVVERDTALIYGDFTAV